MQDHASNPAPRKLRSPQSASKSIAGGRSENQDASSRKDDPAIYIVADGMGGHFGGKLASQLAAQILQSELEKWSSRPDRSLADWNRCLQQSLEGIAVQLSRMARQHLEYDGMGCTLAVGTLEGNRLFYSHLGDCRIYLFRKGKLKRLTEDESLAQELYDAHMLSAKQLEHHRWRHIVTNSVSSHGLQHPVRAHELELLPGDRLLFATNGLSEKCDEKTIREFVATSESPIDCIESLMLAAAENTLSEHNATAIIVFVESIDPLPDT